MTIGRVVQLWRYPVKSLGGEQVDGAVLSSGDGGVHAKLSELAGREVRLTHCRPPRTPACTG